MNLPKLEQRFARRLKAWWGDEDVSASVAELMIDVNVCLPPGRRARDPSTPKGQRDPGIYRDYMRTYMRGRRKLKREQKEAVGEDAADGPWPRDGDGGLEDTGEIYDGIGENTA